MDQSSRNILKFIGALTGAILLLMAAYYFSQSNEPKPQVQAEVVKPVVKAKDAAADPSISEEGVDENGDGVIDGGDEENISGAEENDPVGSPESFTEPAMNIDEPQPEDNVEE